MTSTVCTRQVPSRNRYTPASSPAGMPEMTAGSVTAGRRPSTDSRSPGGIFDAQPALCTCSVSLICALSAESRRSPAHGQMPCAVNKVHGHPRRGSQMQCPSNCERCITRRRLTWSMFMVESMCKESSILNERRPLGKRTPSRILNPESRIFHSIVNCDSLVIVVKGSRFRAVIRT